jgi:hypothetical protein
MTCQEAAELVSRGFDRDLTLAQRAGLVLHLAICWACRRLRRQLRLIDRAVADWAGVPAAAPDAPALRPEAKELMRFAIHQEMERGG